MGHILASGSNDHTTRFWTRHRPLDPSDLSTDTYIYGKPEGYVPMQPYQKMPYNPQNNVNQR